jgi:hypothetical protein
VLLSEQGLLFSLLFEQFLGASAMDDWREPGRRGIVLLIQLLPPFG